MADEEPHRRRPFRSIAWILAAWFVWTLLVFYPNPADLARSLHRVAQPPVDSHLVRSWADSLPDDPAAVEAAVREAYPYRHDWQSYGRPWYYPTTEEALASGGGDCKTEFILIASLLEAKGIPYETRISLTHIWADWEGRTARGGLEAQEASVWSRDGDGRFRWQLPDWELALPSGSLLRHAWWELMPPLRQALFAAGSLAALAGVLGVCTSHLLRRRLDPAADHQPGLSSEASNA